MTTTHTLVIELDTEYAQQFPDHPPEYCWRVECSDPAACPGLIKCDGDHAGFDPDDEDSPAYGFFEDFEIHAELHTWHRDLDWCVDYPGCPLEDREIEPPGDMPRPLKPGRWAVEADWDEDYCELVFAKEDQC